MRGLHAYIRSCPLLASQLSRLTDRATNVAGGQVPVPLLVTPSSGVHASMRPKLPRDPAGGHINGMLLPYPVSGQPLSRNPLPPGVARGAPRIAQGGLGGPAPSAAIHQGMRNVAAQGPLPEANEGAGTLVPARAGQAAGGAAGVKAKAGGLCSRACTRMRVYVRAGQRFSFVPAQPSSSGKSCRPFECALYKLGPTGPKRAPQRTAFTIMTDFGADPVAGV